MYLWTHSMFWMVIKFSMPWWCEDLEYTDTPQIEFRERVHPWVCVVFYFLDLWCLLVKYLSLDKHFSWLLLPQSAHPPPFFFTLVEFRLMLLKWISSRLVQTLFFKPSILYQSSIWAATWLLWFKGCQDAAWQKGKRPAAWICHQKIQIPLWSIGC